MTNRARPIYANKHPGSHVLPEGVAEILGNLVEGGVFHLTRKNSQSDSGLKITSEVDPGGEFLLYVSEWSNHQFGGDDTTLLAMRYSWDGELLHARVDDSDTDEDLALEFLSGAASRTNFQVKLHQEIPCPQAA